MRALISYWRGAGKWFIGRGMRKGLNIHIYPSDITSESRMMKVTAALAGMGYFSKILLIGILSPATKPQETIDELREIRRFARSFSQISSGTFAKIFGTLHWSWAVWRDLRGQHITCINCHSLPVLPLCVALKFRHKALLVYDTHELETETSVSCGLRRVLVKALEAGFIRYADDVFCVGDMIARWYQQRYGIKKPFVIRNIPDSLPPPVGGGGPPLRQKLGLGMDAVIVLYLGKISLNRGVERLLRLFAQVRHLHLVFMGDGELVRLVQDYGARHPSIHYLPPVPIAEVVAHARGADIGVSVIDHSCLSYTYAMPNKFFEYLQAGIPVLIGDMPEQREIIEAHDTGWLLPESDELAIAFLNGLMPDDIRRKQRNTAAIAHLYSWAGERALLVSAYEQMHLQHPDKF